MARYEQLTDDLTLDEQARLASGAGIWHTAGLPDRGIPAIKVSDGPVGVRGESHTTTTSASFPCGSALGATFDTELVGRVAGTLADEARTKAAHVLLGPTVNLHRHPLGGRNFEAYSEDPLLTARLAVAFVRALQERGVAACVKHFVANDAEIERHTISSELDDRTLREVYLPPFEAAVLEAGTWSVMGSYNRLRGTYACEHEWLLTELLKREWGFDGVVISDWYATRDTVRCALAGLDLEMPRPAPHFGPALAAAVTRGDVPAAVVADKARRLLRLADRVGAQGGPEPAEQSIDDPDRWNLARETAAAAMVLLQNREVDGRPVLPLDPAALRRVAVIGANADVAVIQGGGSAQVTPHRTVTPLAGIEARLGAHVDVAFERGGTTGAILPVLDDRLAWVDDGQRGVRMTYRAAADGPELLTTIQPRLDPFWHGRFSPVVDPSAFHVTASATIRPTEMGIHTFGLTSVGPAKLSIDGMVLLDTAGQPRGSAFFGFGTKQLTADIDLADDDDYELVVEYTCAHQDLSGFRVGVRAPLGHDPMGRAAALAAASDVAVVVVGTDEEWETEGRDRHTMALPGTQDELVRAVAAANPRTVVVVNAGAAIDMPWADEVAAILVTWFPGMAGGEALARVLVGDDEPAGRLPITVPVHLEDAPSTISQADPPGELHYTEGILVGHRWYLTNGVEPRWWFGQGQGYTTFTWGAPSAPATWTPGSPLAVTVPVTNSGSRGGAEVVQVYLRRPHSRVERPAWALGGFAKVRVEPGATVVVEVGIDSAAIRHWDADRSIWVVEPGPLELRVARSAADRGQVVVLDVQTA